MRTFTHAAVALALASLALLAFPGCSAEAKKNRALERANKYYAAREYDKAEVEYLNVLRAEDMNFEGISRLGLIYFDQGRLGRVHAFLNQARSMKPDDLPVRVKVGLMNAASGRVAEAREDARFVLQREPGNAEAAVLLADTANTPQLVAETRQILQQLPAPASSGAPVATALAFLDLRMKNWDAAEEGLKRALKLDPTYASPHLGLAFLYGTRNDLPAAGKELAEAARLSPIYSSATMQYAKFKLQHESIAAGKAYLEEVTKKAPDYLPAWLLLADIAAGEKAYDVCLNHLGIVLRRDADHPEAMLLSARARLAQGDFNRAMADVERALQVYPQSAQFYAQQGAIYVAMGDLVKAGVSLTQALTLAPGYVEATLLLADINIRQGNVNAAVMGLRKVVGQIPNDVQPRILLAHALRLQGKGDEAMAIYDDLQKVFPQNAQIPFLKGFLFVELKKETEARQSFTRALEMAPNYLLALEQLVDLDLAAGNFPAAKRQVEGFLAKNAEAAGGYLVMAKIHLAEKDNAAAEAALLKVVKLEPTLPFPYFLLARLYVDSKEPEKAVANLQQVAANNPKDTESLMLIGVIREEQKNLAEARANYEKLLQINPKFPPALNNLAYIYAEHFNEVDKAYELAQRARALVPLEPHTADTLGWILYRKGQYSYALTFLAESADRLASIPEVHYHLGMTHYMLGDEAQARQAFEKALALGKEFQGQADAQQALRIVSLDPATVGAAEQAGLEKIVAQRPDPVALVRLAAIAERAGNVGKAVSLYESAQKLSPNNVPVAINLIRLYGARNETAKALELARNTRKLASNDPDVAHKLGRLAYQNRDYAWSAGLLQEAVSRRSDSPEVLYDYALASYSVGQLSAADEALNKALKLNPLFENAAGAREYVQLSALAANGANAAEASAKIEEVLKRDPNHLPALMAKAAALEQRGNPAAAADVYEAILARYPDFNPSKRKLALQYADSTAPLKPKAVEYASQARTAFPQDAELGKAYGILLFRQGNYPLALRVLQESSRQFPTDASVFYHLGMTQHQLKDTAASATSLQRALDLKLDPKLAAQAREILKNGKQTGS